MNKDDQLMMGLRTLLNKLAYLNKFKMEEALNAYKPSEVHCIEYIANNPHANVTKLAEAFYMTRSAISKIIKKLIEKNFIESYQKPENKKEIYFKLTPQGKEINEIHQKLHKEFQDRDKPVFNQITDKQLDDMINFIEIYNTHLDEEITSNIN